MNIIVFVSVPLIAKQFAVCVCVYENCGYTHGRALFPSLLWCLPLMLCDDNSETLAFSVIARTGGFNNYNS